MIRRMCCGKKAQHKIDEIERENQMLPAHLRMEAVVLAYGLCSNRVIGLHSRSLPVIVPRCDDCISLFLGSAERYRKLFRELPGIYWYNNGWIEQAFTPSRENYVRQRAVCRGIWGGKRRLFDGVHQQLDGAVSSLRVYHLSAG